RQQRIDPANLDISRGSADDLRGGSVEANAGTVRELFAGKLGPVRDAVLINAAGALAAYDGPDDDLPAQLRSGVEQAAEAIDSGAAADLLTRWAKRSGELRATPA